MKDCCFRILFVLCAIVFCFSNCDHPPVEGEAESLPNIPGKAVVSKDCAVCHQQEYQDWLGSHHDKALQTANDSSVLGNFNNATFQKDGITTRFFKKDGGYWIHTEGPDGELQDFRIDYVIGIAPLQQYLVAFPGGRYQAFSVVWDTEKDRWFSLYPDEKITHDDPLHWSGVYQNWNMMCAECHSTNLTKNFDFENDTYHTRWDEINVGCQACHGNGSAHIAWAEKYDSTDKSPPRSELALRNDFKAQPQIQLETCAPCHSRRLAITANDAHELPYLDHFQPELLRSGMYYPDGQILEEVYVYGSFRQSKMFQAGVRCSDCHNPHSLALVAEGNELCNRCHQSEAVRPFENLKIGNYDSPEHHFHKNGSEGAMCVNCHMPSRNYMVVDPRRDHSFIIPRPEATIAYGTPNPCNSCHTEKSPEWALQKMEDWYGPRQEIPLKIQALAEGQLGKPGSIEKLTELVQDKTMAGIVRATALSVLAELSGPTSKSLLQKSVSEKDPLLRISALEGLSAVSPEERVVIAAPLLQDKSRSVRITAARMLTTVPVRMRIAVDPSAYQSALAEYKAMLYENADQPANLLNMGISFEYLQQADSAEIAYRAAIAADSYFLPAYFNLASFLSRQQRNDEAEIALKDGLKYAPEEGELHYSLGLLLAEEQRLSEAINHLAKAAEALTNRPRVLYNYALALQHLERRPAAEANLIKANRMDPRDPTIVHALAIFYVQDENWEKAEPFARQLVQLTGNDPGAQQLLQMIENARK